MNILIVNTYYTPMILGGAEISVQKLAEGLVNDGHKVSVLCTNTKDTEEVINDVKVIRMKIKNLYSPIESKSQNMIKKILYKVIDIFNIFNVGKLLKIINEQKPDIIHTNNIFGISPVIWYVATAKKIPVIHTLRDYYLLNPFENNTSDLTNNLYKKIHILTNRKFSKKVDFVTAPSKFTLKKFLDNSYFSNAKQSTVYNAIQLDEKVLDGIYNKKNENIMNYNKIKFVYLGTFTKHKGIEFLLETFTSIKESQIELHLAGKGELQDLVERYLNIDNRIVFHGFLNEGEINNLLIDCHILIVPSLWEEPFGRVVLDAYKNGLPVIASDIGGLSEIVINQKTGYLVKPGDSKELKDSINLLKKSNIRKKMLLNCRNELEKFSLKSQIENFVNIYKSLIR